MPRTIQNHALAGCELVIGGQTVQGDAEGRFTVPDEWAAKVLGTPGWTSSDIEPKAPQKVDPVGAIRERAAPAPEPPPAPPEPEPTPEPEPARDDDTPAETPSAKAASEPAPEPGPRGEETITPDGEEGEEEGPDLTGMKRAELLSVAEKYGIEVTKAQERGKVDELRAYLDEQLYGEET